MSTSSAQQPRSLLPLIVLSQFAGTALWFASNAILDNLTIVFDLPANALGYLTSAVQLGFISGTLLFAFYLLADRFSPSKVFMICAALGAIFNAGILFYNGGLWGLVGLRFLTGFCLAGIYPVGMKIASDWYQSGLGKALGYLVGALVIGTAFPHFLKSTIGQVDWKLVIVITSVAALSGGLLVGFLIPDGPYRKLGAQFDPKVIIEIFKFPKFRSAAFGYFGHMWELYAFWAFLPYFLLAWSNTQGQVVSISLWAFILISLGGLACVLGGYWSLKKGSKQVAWLMLLTSGLCCALSPLVFIQGNIYIFLIFLGLWGFSVVGDSPQFSTLVARHAPEAYRGSALTIVNCIGFALTIGSIQLLSYLSLVWPTAWLFVALIPGPVLGLLAIKRIK